MTLEGYFARFGEWTTVDNPKEGPRFRESVAKGAFSKTIAEGRGRIKLQLAHGQDPQVGDNPIGKLSELREDSHGGFYRADLFRLPELIEDGLRAQQFGASFRFSTVREDYTARPPRSDYNVERIPERVLREVRLFEISATSWPAYAGTSAVVRSEGDVIVMR
ncbi:MAG TPA: HK97 family phage prohead protease, partial [Gaiellaceae bacterium]|nr:HK97 family phage prohead protease [Gaiellaceae bacterium]